MKRVSIIDFIITLRVLIYFLRANPDFVKVILACLNCCPITYKMFKDLDANPSFGTCGIFLNISKAFDSFWHEALIFKLPSYGISDSLLCLFNSFLSEMLQVILNGQAFERRKVLTGVPQGSILEPLLFLLFINDIPANLECNLKIFADNTFIFSFVRDPNESSSKLGRDLGRVAGWAYY